DRQVLEDDVHDGVEQRFEVFALQQHLGDLDEDLEDLLARGRHLAEAWIGRHPRRRLLQLGQVQAELRIEIGDAPDHRAGGVVEHRFAGEVHRQEALQLELHGADEDLVAGIHLGPGDEVPVHLHPVRRLQIGDPPAVVAQIEAGVAPRDRWMIENEVVSFRAADRQLSFEIRHPWYAEVDVVDLKLFHRRRSIIAFRAGAYNPAIVPNIDHDGIVYG